MSRLNRIIELVSERKQIEVNELAEIFDVSKVTIRKDLDKLVEREIIRREHGFALINNENNLNYRLAINYDIKHKIAQAAAKSVKDGEAILIESGSTCTLLAEEIAKTHKDITVITNSAYISNYIRKYDTVDIILLGGEYQKTSQVTIGPLLEQAVQNFRVDKFFLGVDGYDVDRGFTTRDMHRGKACRVLASIADESIILTDSSKFDKYGVIQLFDLDEIDVIYTDSQLTDDFKEHFEENGIKVYTV